MKDSFRVLVLLVVMSAVGGCWHGGESSSLLATVDTLLLQHHDSLALATLQRVDVSALGQADRAYYGLLLTQAQYKNYVNPSSDSLIKASVEHYSHTGEQEKLSRALLYQGCVSEELGDLDQAVACYHRVEVDAGADDVANRAYAKLRLGYLYQSQVVGSTTLALAKFREALPLFEAAGDRHYQLLCLSEMGNIYRNIDARHDSATAVMAQAIAVARQLGDDYMLFANLFAMSEFYLVRKHDYRQAKTLGLAALAAGGSQIDHPRAHYRLAEAYAELGQLDSALYYASHAPRAVTAADTILYHGVMSAIERRRGHAEQAHAHYLLADRLDDSVLVAGLNHRLVAVERKYDTQRLELQNAVLQSQRLQLALGMTVAVMVACVLAWLVAAGRRRLAVKQQQYDDAKAQLGLTLDRLHDIAAQNSELEANEKQSQQLQSVVKHQIGIVQQMIEWSETLTADKFLSRFSAVMTLPKGNAKSRARSKANELPEFWRNLHALANALHHNVLERAQQACGGTLRDDELNYLALYSCGFERSVIMACLGYQNMGTVYNKRLRVARLLGVADLDQFIMHCDGSRVEE